MGIGSVMLGVLLVIVAYVFTPPAANAVLVAGFVLMGGGLVTLSQWR